MTVDFDLTTGLSKSKKSTVRMLSQMRAVFSDKPAYDAALAQGDRKVYEFYELGLPEDSAYIAAGTSITYPGDVGGEYYMTKGHFHAILETAEAYYCLSGEGFMLMESPEGDVRLEKLAPGDALFVPPRYAHRSINSGSTPLVTFFAFRADAGHDYKTIETRGFKKLVLRGPRGPELRDNPLWTK